MTTVKYGKDLYVSRNNPRYSTENPTFGGSVNGSLTPGLGGKTTLYPTREDLQGSPLDLQCNWDTLENVRIYLARVLITFNLCSKIVYYPRAHGSTRRRNSASRQLRAALVQVWRDWKRRTKVKGGQQPLLASARLVMSHFLNTILAWQHQQTHNSENECYAAWHSL